MNKKTPFTLTGLDHLLMLVDDMDAAIEFYQSVVGCGPVNRMDQYAMAELQAGRSTLALVDWKRPEGAWAAEKGTNGRNLDHFALALGAGSETGLRAHLAACHVAIVEERVEDDGRLSLYFNDPAGNTVELILPAG